MTRFDKIKQLNLDELLDYIGDTCSRCEYDNKDCLENRDMNCRDGNKLYLLKEEEL